MTRRIVTTSTTPVAVGPRVTQWAYGLQPRDGTAHYQVRKERDDIAVEAVDRETGELLARAGEIVSLRRGLAAAGRVVAGDFARRAGVAKAA